MLDYISAPAENNLEAESSPKGGGFESRRILIVVPNLTRDLEGHSLVAHHLERRYGHEVELCVWQHVWMRLRTFRPDALVLDDIGWRPKVELANFAKRLGVKVVILAIQCEGEAERAGKLLGARNIADCYLVWGTASRQTLLDESLVEPDRLHVVGCSRFDFYRAPYLSLVEPRPALDRRLRVANPGGPLVVWATSGTGRLRVNQVRRRVSQANLTEEVIRAEFADIRAAHVKLAEFLRILARRHPDWNFLVKPHPSENVAGYRAMTGELSNVILAERVTIRDVLCHCDVLLQHCSTTATEAWMLGKPVLQVDIGTSRRKWPEAFVMGTQLVGDVDEAETAILQYLAGTPIPESQQRAREAYISDYYCLVDGKSSERCAEKINSAVSPPAYSDEEKRRTNAALLEAHRLWSAAENSRLSNLVKDALGIDRGESLRFWKDWSSRGAANRKMKIDPHFVQLLQRRFDEVESLSPPRL